MSPLVIDASVAACWLFDDEQDSRADQALTALSEREGIVPTLWHYEMRNILLVAQRRQRLDANQAQQRLHALDELPLSTDAASQLNQAFALAETLGLSYYDALYLELAQRRGATLATLDARMAEAARQTGIECLSN